MTKRIVHIHLAGGCHAPSLFLKAGADQDITALHPAATNLRLLAEQGMVHAIMCTGPEDPNGSHFAMTRAQQDRTPIPISNAMTGIGWGDYALAQTFPDATGVVGITAHDSVLMRTLQGGLSKCAALQSNVSLPAADVMTRMFEDAKTAEDLPDKLRDTYLTQLAIASEVGGFRLNFGSLGQTIAQIFAQQPGVKIVTGISGGFDTHTDHTKQFATSLSIFDATLGEFSRAAGWLERPNGDGEGIDLPELDTVESDDDDILMLVTTDFSRDLITTSGDGYSHGRGGFCLLIGRCVKPGFTGSLPALDFEPERLLQGRFLPVEYPTPRVVLSLLEAAGWNREGVFTKDYEPLPGLFVERGEEPEEPDPVEEPEPEPDEPEEPGPAPKLHFEAYQSNLNKLYYWRLRDEERGIIAIGGEGFADKADVLIEIEMIRTGAADAPITAP